jgi:hypothetical protein
MLYEKLDPPMRAMVDTWAERLRGVPWARRSDLLAEAARPFAEQFSGEQARTASRGFVTAVLERLAEDKVTDPYQASMYYLSLHPAHRAAAAAYLEAHPEVREIVEGPLDPSDEGDPAEN